MIGALIALLSLDMTSKLIAANVIATTLSVSGATGNAVSPIVLTTSVPHSLVRATHAQVASVGGNAAANGLWVLTPTDATHVSLSTFDLQGNLVQSVGSGAYTSGGTIQIGFPDGSILLGRRNVDLNMAAVAPRIVFVPMGSPAWDLEPYGGFIPPATKPRTLASLTAEQKTMKLQQQLWTEKHRFEVHVTGCANPPDPDFGDFDATQALYQSLGESLFRLVTPPRARVLSGSWASQLASMQTIDIRGQKWVGQIEIEQPVTPPALSFVQSGTAGIITVAPANAGSTDSVVINLPPVP